jgi:HlyD family secretion protein
MTRNAVLFSLILWVLAACNSRQEKVRPMHESITESVYASGIIKSNNQYEVFSKVNGLVAGIMVQEGDMIKKGDPIIQLADVTARLNTENAQLAADFATQKANADKLRELQVNIDQAKIKLDNDTRLFQRQQQLWAQQIGTRNDLEQRELAYQSSLNNYEAARLRYAELLRQISFQEKQSQKNVQIYRSLAGDYTIKSEVNGKVYNVLKEKGEMVNTQTAVAVIGDATSFVPELQVDEFDIACIKTGQKILLTMDSYKGQVFEAVVTTVKPFMNQRSKTFTVEARFVNPPPLLYPNLTCEANILIREKQQAVTIPRSWLMEGDYVILLNKEKRKVTTGLKDYEKVEITGGLNMQDIIIKPAP